MAAIKEILYTKREAFTLFTDGSISRHRGEFTEDPEGRYIRDVYVYPAKPDIAGSKSLSQEEAAAEWRWECRNVEEMNALAKQRQRAEYRKKVKLVRKQWKAQRPSWLDRIMARVRD